MKPISTDVVSVLQELITQRKTNMQMIKISEVIAMKDICTSYTGGIKESYHSDVVESRSDVVTYEIGWVGR